MTRPSICGSGFNIFTTADPRVAPIIKIMPILTGINHLDGLISQEQGDYHEMMSWKVTVLARFENMRAGVNTRNTICIQLGRVQFHCNQIVHSATGFLHIVPAPEKKKQKCTLFMCLRASSVRMLK